MEWIQKGSKGDEVLDVQNRLKERGFDPGPIDGIFGSKTETAVRAFQEKHNLQVDGIVGPETGGALGMLEVAGVPTDAEQEARLKAMKARSDDMAEKTKQKKAAEKQREAIEALKKKEHEERQKAEAKKSDAVEAVTGAVKKTGDKVEEEFDSKVGGSLWSRITGRNRKRDR
jgi:peptidoglycan hydrolase-like protein with peptidoglycan-binding domain